MHITKDFVKEWGWWWWYIHDNSLRLIRKARTMPMAMPKPMRVSVCLLEVIRVVVVVGSVFCIACEVCLLWVFRLMLSEERVRVCEREMRRPRESKRSWIWKMSPWSVRVRVRESVCEVWWVRYEVRQDGRASIRIIRSVRRIGIWCISLLLCCVALLPAPACVALRCKKGSLPPLGVWG